MATLCKNCYYPLVFDPDSQKLVCGACGSSFRAEEVEAEAKRFREDLKARSMQSVYGTDEKEYLDCYVYSCSECGGEIIINGSEASTTCVYCGNPNVVFSRIAKQMCPEFVMPFSISREKALDIVHKKLNKGFFIPKEIKNFSADCIRGIYIPYWIVNAEYTDAVVVSGRVKSGKSSTTRYFGRAGRMNIKNLPLDASTALSDESSSKLEPFDLTKLVPFDEDYLAGFYSNVSDVTYSDVRVAAFARAKEYFNEQAIDSVRASSKKIVSSFPSMNLDNNMVYVMLPAWFITFNYQGKHNTILVNGDTGKVVCGLPWDRKKFYICLAAIGIVATVLLFFVFKGMLPAFLDMSRTSSRHSSSSDGSGGKLIIYIIAGIVALFSSGIAKVKRVLKNIHLTQDKDIFNFTKKRQG